MVDTPGIQITLKRHEKLECLGKHQEIAASILERLQQEPEFKKMPFQIQIEIDEGSAAHHVGLGTGTQVALSITEGLHKLFGLDVPGQIDLARLSGRAKRSAIGTHGYFEGGFLVDGGKRSNEEVAPLVERVDIPEEWRFLLVCPAAVTPIFGEDEKKRLAEAPAPPIEISASMMRDVAEYLLPALHDANFNVFSNYLFEYGTKAGLAYASVQEGGIFRHPRVVEIIYQLRNLGVKGVGQTSWGPTVFALFQSENDAVDCQNKIETLNLGADLDVYLAKPSNQGRELTQCTL